MDGDDEGGGALPRVFPITGKEDDLDGVVNVVLVGNMGVGKSTLGNYLFNLGDKASYLFETSADPTTSCRLREREREREREEKREEKRERDSFFL